MSTNPERYTWVGAVVVVLFLPVLLLASGSTSSGPTTVAAAVAVPSQQITSHVFYGGQQVPDIRPRQIFIPSINLNSKIVDIGTTTDGNLGVPVDFGSVGWYKYGTIPGEIGTAVFDAHNDNGALIPGPFKHLHEVKSGDSIYITSADGAIRKFVVADLQAYPLGQFPSDLVFYDKSGALIKIITCYGTFIPSENTYDQRLIVTGRLVN
ncbi:MAG: class F sortase [Patescibacteria group bacterium]